MLWAVCPVVCSVHYAVCPDVCTVHYAVHSIVRSVHYAVCPDVCTVHHAVHSIVRSVHYAVCCVVCGDWGCRLGAAGCSLEAEPRLVWSRLKPATPSHQEKYHVLSCIV